MFQFSKILKSGKTKSVNIRGLREGFIDRCSHKYLEMPHAESFTGWRKWKEKQKAEKPVLFFLLQTLPHFINFRLHCVDRFIYGLKSRLFYKQHHLKIDLKRWDTEHYHPIHSYGYKDPSWLIKFGVFQAFLDYVDFELISEKGHIDWDGDKRHKDLKKRMLALHKWLTVTRPKLIEESNKYPDPEQFGFTVDSVLDMLDVREEDLDAERKKQYKAYRKAQARVYALSDKIQKTEAEVLHKIINIHDHLWG